MYEFSINYTLRRPPGVALPKKSADSFWVTAFPCEPPANRRARPSRTAELFEFLPFLLIGQYSLETYFFTEAAARELLNQLSHNFDKKHYGTRDSDLGFTL